MPEPIVTLNKESLRSDCASWSGKQPRTITSKMLMQARSMKGRPLPRIQISYEMDSFERQRPQWTLYSNSPPTATGSST